jgi:mitochondrial import inner membrane translocase subunit TIM50
MFGVEDVREVIKSFEGKYVPTEFSRREQLMREKVLASSKSRLSTQNTGSGFLGKLAGGLGMTKPSMGGGGATMVGSDGIPINVLEEMARGKTIFDIYREQNMKDYKAQEKYIKENGEQILKEEAEMMKKFEAEEMKKMKGNFFGMFTGGEAEMEKSSEKKD